MSVAQPILCVRCYEGDLVKLRMPKVKRVSDGEVFALISSPVPLCFDCEWEMQGSAIAYSHPEYVRP